MGRVAFIARVTLEDGRVLMAARERAIWEQQDAAAEKRERTVAVAKVTVAEKGLVAVQRIGCAPVTAREAKQGKTRSLQSAGMIRGESY